MKLSKVNWCLDAVFLKSFFIPIQTVEVRAMLPGMKTFIAPTIWKRRIYGAKVGFFRKRTAGGFVRRCGPPSGTPIVKKITKLVDSMVTDSWQNEDGSRWIALEEAKIGNRVFWDMKLWPMVEFMAIYSIYIIILNPIGFATSISKKLICLFPCMTHMYRYGTWLNWNTAQVLSILISDISIWKSYMHVIWKSYMWFFRFRASACNFEHFHFWGR